MNYPYVSGCKILNLFRVYYSEKIVSCQKKIHRSMYFFGARGGVRTHDLGLMSPTL